MKVNVIKAKDKYAQSWRSLDWHDHIHGMSARDVELEVDYAFEQVCNEMLEEINESIKDLLCLQGSVLESLKVDKRWDGVYELLQKQIDRKKQLIKEATEI